MCLTKCRGLVLLAPKVWNEGERKSGFLALLCSYSQHLRPWAIANRAAYFFTFHQNQSKLYQEVVSIIAALSVAKSSFCLGCANKASSLQADPAWGTPAAEMDLIAIEGVKSVKAENASQLSQQRMLQQLLRLRDQCT